MTGSYTNIRHDTLDYLDREASESCSHLHSNTTSLPRLNDRFNNTSLITPRSTSAPSARMRFNDDGDGFRSNTPNTSFFTTDNDSRSIFRTSYNGESTPPAPFCDMRNVQQICSWLCANSDILLLAYNMYLSMQLPVTSTFNLISPSYNQPTLATDV